MNKYRAFALLTVMVLTLTGCKSEINLQTNELDIVEPVTEEEVQLSEVGVEDKGDRPTVGDIKVDTYIPKKEEKVEEIDVTSTSQESYENEGYTKANISQVNDLINVDMEVSIDKWGRVCDILHNDPDAILIDGKELRFKSLEGKEILTLLTELSDSFGLKRITVNGIRVSDLLEYADIEGVDGGTREYFEKVLDLVDSGDVLSLDLSWNATVDTSFIRLVVNEDSLGAYTAKLKVKITSVVDDVYLRFDEAASDIKVVDSYVSGGSVFLEYDIPLVDKEVLD